MTASELIERARQLCRRTKRTLPGELGGYARAWQRQRFDMSWCWTLVRDALRQGRALWQVDAAVRSHHADLQQAREARERSLCPPVLAPSTVHHRSSQGSLQAAALHSGFDLAEDDNIEESDFWPAHHETESPRPARQKVASPPVASGGRSETSRGHSGQSYVPVEVAGRANSKANKVRALLKAHVLRRGPIPVWKLESIARSEGLLRHDQPLGRCSTFRRIAEDLGIESYRIGFGRGASYVWRLKPPEWTRSLDQPAD